MVKEVEELYFGFYQTSVTSSDVLYAIVQDVLLRSQFSIKKCRGQCYDGAANVSGHVTGLRTKILQEESRATYVYCRAHKLNLAAHDALKSRSEIRSVMGMIQDLTAFIRGSPNRMAWFDQFSDVESDDSAFTGNKSLRPFCPTRWTMRLISIQAITNNYMAILKWLKDVNETQKKTFGFKANGFLKSLKDFNTFFFVEVPRMVFTIVEGTSYNLKGIQLSFSKSEAVIKCIKESISNARNKSHFANIWQAIEALVSKINLIPEPHLSWQHKAPQRVDDGPAIPFIPSTPEEFYRGSSTLLSWIAL